MDPEYARAAFGLAADATLTPGPRGAIGQIWRVTTLGGPAGPGGPAAVLALKEIFADPPSEAVVEASRAFGAVVRIPASHRDRTGRCIVPTPDGTWLRLFDWIDLRPIDPVAPADLGVLLARLHLVGARLKCADASAAMEIDGHPPDPWYETVADAGDLTGFVQPADTQEMVLCHRDLHPENVLADAYGDLVVVDWDLLGPAVPSRELARALFDWFSDPAPDLGAMRAMDEAYRKEGGPGRITRPADFTMLVATRLNFLRRQQRIAANPLTEPQHREWAEREVAEGLRTLPTPGQLTAVLDALATDPVVLRNDHP